MIKGYIFAIILISIHCHSPKVTSNSGANSYVLDSENQEISYLVNVQETYDAYKISIDRVINPSSQDLYFSVYIKTNGNPEPLGGFSLFPKNAPTSYLIEKDSNLDILKNSSHIFLSTDSPLLSDTKIYLSIIKVKY